MKLKFEAKRKLAQTEMKMEIKNNCRYRTQDEAEVEQKRLEFEKKSGVPITRHTPTIKLPKLELQKFNENILTWQ